MYRCAIFWYRVEVGDFFVFFVKQKTAYGVRISDWSSDVCSSDLDQLDAVACRILVPGYSEVYPVEDLIWYNTNKALLFRADILNLHRLDDAWIGRASCRERVCQYV